MIKRIVIAGCRDYNNYHEAKKYIDYYLSNIQKENHIIILSGCASGADAIGERYAKENNLKVEKHPANWEKYGKSKGTKSMINLAKEYKKPIRVIKIP